MSAKNYDPVAHSTEHLLNRVMDNLFHCGRPLSMHLEKKKSRSDYAIDHQLSKEEIRLIESTLNGLLAQDLEVKIYFVSPENAPPMADVSKLPPAALEHDIRIVQIGEYDYSACIGPHVSRTSEIRGTFHLNSSSFENGALRIRWTIK
jgi:Ser-tRNA(Ala) deacylase AlaX